jgi:hypothetical protein
VGVADDASFYVDRWGAPLRTVDALGNQMLLQRDPVTGLVGRVQFGNGRIVGAGYNTRGNLLYVADSTYEGTGTTQTVATTFGRSYFIRRR